MYLEKLANFLRDCLVHTKEARGNVQFLVGSLGNRSTEILFSDYSSV